MKKIVVVLLVLLVSCSDIYFESPLPEKGEELKNFPTKLVGKYLNAEKDTIIFQNSHILTGIIDLNIKLGENAKLIHYNEDYYVNLKSAEGWQFFKIVTNANGLTCYFNTTNEIIERLPSEITHKKKFSNYIIKTLNYKSLKLMEEEGFFNKIINLKKLE